MSSSVTLAKWDSVFGIDAVEAFPSGISHSAPGCQQHHRSETRQQLACVATYALGGDGVRRGRLVVLRAVVAGTDSSTVPTGTLEPIVAVGDHESECHPNSENQLPGVLDIRCCSESANQILADCADDEYGQGMGSSSYVLAVCADASLRIFVLRQNGTANGTTDFIFTFERGVHIRSGKSWLAGNIERTGSENEVGCKDGDGLLIALSVDYVEDPAGKCLIASVTDSRGAVHIMQISSRDIQMVHTIEKAHHAESWTACLRDGNPSQCGRPNTVEIISGGDDGTLKGWQLSWDASCISKHKQEIVPTFTVRKAHNGVGVTSLCAPCAELNTYLDSHTLFTGGYDDTFRLWDTRMMRKCVSELDVGGGIWRIKPNPANSNQLLLACMYDGFKIVECKQDGSLTVVATHSGHASLAYGASWLQDMLPPDEGLSREICLTGSFYDHSLQLWSQVPH